MSQTSTTPNRDGELLTCAYVHIKNIGLYDVAIEKWDDIISPYCTWDNFKQDFLTAYIKEQTKPKAEAVMYNVPNSVGKENQLIPQANQQSVAETVVNLLVYSVADQLSEVSEISAANRVSFANLTTGNTILAHTNSELMTRIN